MAGEKENYVVLVRLEEEEQAAQRGQGGGVVEEEELDGLLDERVLRGRGRGGLL